MNYIIDTDPGVDDALALLFAIGAGMSIKGITTVFGNASITKTTKNTLTILELLNKNIPVYKGCGKPIQGKATFASSHGDNGLGGFTKQINSTPESLSAIEYMKDQSTQDKFSIIALGPATNIARSIEKYPELSQMIDTIIFLSGVVNEKGNITPYAEFNAYNDPVALQIILDIPCKKVMIPINVCRRVTFALSDFTRLSGLTMRKTVQEITSMYIDYYMNNSTYGGFTGGVMYDLLAVIYAKKPELFSKINANIQVITKNKKKWGETRIFPTLKPNCSLVTNVHVEALKSYYFSIMNNTKITLQ